MTCVICERPIGYWDLEPGQFKLDNDVCASCWWAYDDAELRAYVLGITRFEEYRDSLLRTESSQP